MRLLAISDPFTDRNDKFPPPFVYWNWWDPYPYTAVSRKVVAKTVHATIPKSNMGYDQCTFSWHCSCRTYFCCFALALANVRPWTLVPFFQIYLKNSQLKTTHNTFRDCRVHFFRQPFSKAPLCRKLPVLAIIDYPPKAESQRVRE